MNKLRNYVWTFPSVLILLTTIVVGACAGNRSVQGNPAQTMLVVEQNIDALWVTITIGFSVMVLLALWFWYQLNEVNKRLLNKGINV